MGSAPLGIGCSCLLRRRGCWRTSRRLRRPTRFEMSVTPQGFGMTSVPEKRTSHGTSRSSYFTCAPPVGHLALRVSHERVEPASNSIKSFARRSMRAHWATTWRSGPPSASAYARAPAESRSLRPGGGVTSSGISTRARAQVTFWSASRSTSVPEMGSCRGSNVRSPSAQAYWGVCRHSRGALMHLAEDMLPLRQAVAWSALAERKHAFC